VVVRWGFAPGRGAADAPFRSGHIPQRWPTQPSWIRTPQETSCGPSEVRSADPAQRSCSVLRQRGDPMPTV